jgi:transposase
MRKVQEVLRLLLVCGLSQRQASLVSGMARASVAEYLVRAQRAGLLETKEWESLSREDLEQRLYPPAVATTVRRERPEVGWQEVHEELRRKGMTLSLIWEEYRERCPEGYQYSRFCELYREWRGKLDLSMRQSHRAGEKLFVDYCGDTVSVVDGEQVRQAQIFVAVWGASSYTFAEATWSQGLSDWIHSHVRAFEFGGGLTELVVPDNLRSGVTRACRYEPEINPTYQDLAVHYGVAVIPARVRKPRDKAKVEAGVQLVQRWILARLRNRKFFSLAELNQAIGELLVGLNERPFRKLPGSRRSQFESLERPALRPLPAERFVYAEWKKVRVGADYHVEVDGHHYSVPYQLVSQQLEVRVSARTVECFAKGKRVASHLRSFHPGPHTTQAEHMPQPHREYASWTPERLVRWAQKSGPAVSELIETILETRTHPQQGFRSCLGITSLGERFGQDRLEAACRRALKIGGAVSYRSVRSILDHGLDRADDDPSEGVALPQVHENLRGASYYGGGEEKPC